MTKFDFTHNPLFTFHFKDLHNTSFEVVWPKTAIQEELQFRGSIVLGIGDSDSHSDFNRGFLLFTALMQSPMPTALFSFATWAAIEQNARMCVRKVSHREMSHGQPTTLNTTRIAKQFLCWFFELLIFKYSMCNQAFCTQWILAQRNSKLLLYPFQKSRLCFTNFPRNVMVKCLSM